MENEKLNITAAPGVSEIIIRHGEAHRVFDPVGVDIKGTINAPLLYLKNRYSTLTAIACMVIVSIVEGMITLTINEHNEIHDRIQGSIRIHPNIESFGINNGKYVSPEDMSNFLRARKHLFESQATYTDVFTALRNFRAKVNQQINAIKDDSGNFEKKKEQAVEHNIPKTFKLNLSIFKGMPKVSFEVEFLVNKDLDITMYSTELIQLTDELREKYITEVVEQIGEVAPDIVIMYQ